MNKDILAKALNQVVTRSKFVDKDLDNYIYASLSQPPIRIISKNNSCDELDYTVECPNCGSHVNYGTETFMLSGHIYCSNRGCREKNEVCCAIDEIIEFESNIKENTNLDTIKNIGTYDSKPNSNPETIIDSNLDVIRDLNIRNKELINSLNDIREYINACIQVLETKYSYETNDEYMNAKLFGGKKELEYILQIIDKALGGNNE